MSQPYPFRVLLPKTHDKHRVRLVTHGANPFQFSCTCHLDCIPKLYTRGGSSSGYGLISIEDDEYGDEYLTEPCHFCNQQ